MNREERSAEALRAWLAAPGAAPVDEIEPDVLEAVVLLRPDLAPPPRVTVDEILAGLPTPGPQRPPAEVLPFPRRAVLLVGGMGGVGMLLAAAATLLVVALPLLQADQHAMQEAAVAVPAEPEAPAAKLPATPLPNAAADGRLEKLGYVDEKPEPDGGRGAARAAAPPTKAADGVELAPVADLPEEVGAATRFDADAAGAAIGGEVKGDGLVLYREGPAAEPPALSMADEQGWDNTASGAGEEREYAQAEALSAPPPPPAGRSSNAKDKSAGLDDLRSAAVPFDEDEDAPKEEASRKTQVAQTAAPQAAAPQAPAPSDLDMGLALLEAGDAQGALAMAEAGLRAERDNTPLRSALLVLKGDALRALGKESAAIGAWEEAARLNAERR